MSSKVKSWLLLSVIFIVGAVTGAALAIGFGPRFIHSTGPGPQQIRKAWMTQLTERLSLTTDQQAKIQPILDDAETKIRNLHREEGNRGAQIFKSVDDQIAALLTPAQNEELKKMQSEREKRFSDHMRVRGFSHDHDGPPDGPGPRDGSPDGSVPPPMPPPPPPAPATNAVPAKP